MSQADFLIEIGSEELPPKALKRLSEAFTLAIAEGLSAQQLKYTKLTTYATPRRLAVLVHDLDQQQADRQQQKLGPALAAAFDANGQATKAAEGFARSCGVCVSELEHIDTDKGVRLGINQVEPGSASRDLLPEVITQALQKLPIPKMMRWGDRSESFIRPVKWIACLHGEEVIKLSLFGCDSDRISHGHRFMNQSDVQLASASDYATSLKQASVMVSQSERMDSIKQQTQALAQLISATAVIDTDLLEEVSALVEWPVALMGDFDEDFLSVPAEALISTMSANQKYFHLVDDQNLLLAHFITIANLESRDPKAIIAGNEKVVRPRLADAKFFYEQDCKHSLTHYSKRLESIVFQKDLGTLADKCQRIAKIAQGIAQVTHANVDHVAQASAICKADLVTDMVGEFPNLQGIMGRYYGQHEDLNPEVCQSLEEIYQPRFAGDVLPETATGICLALADRLDSLYGIFAIGQIPTGNKDPFALRRAALGVLHIIIHHRLDVDLLSLFDFAESAYANVNLPNDPREDLVSFFSARQRAHYLDSGYSAQEFNAVEALSISKPYDFELRIQAVADFSRSEHAEALADTNKRVANILAKNAIDAIDTSVSSELLQEVAEQNLYKAMASVEGDILAAVENAAYGQALTLAVGLKASIDDFFDQVMVMAEDEQVRQNRLKLLYQLRRAFLSVADLSCLQK